MGRKVKVLMSDNGGEYTSKEFKDYLEGKGIKHQLSIAGRPEQNGATERMNQTLTERACSIRLQADMSDGFWVEAVNLRVIWETCDHQQLLIFRSQRRYSEEYMWTIQLYAFSVARYIV